MGLRNWGHGTLTAEYRKWVDPEAGTAELWPGSVTVESYTLMAVAVDSAIVPAGKLADQLPLNTVEDEVAADGRSLQIVLPAVDDADLLHEHKGYKVTIRLEGLQPLVYEGVQILEGQVTDLLELIPAVGRSAAFAASPNTALFPRLIGGVLVDANGNPIGGTAEVGDVQILIDALGGVA